jgi:hypothetical protein
MLGGGERESGRAAERSLIIECSHSTPSIEDERLGDALVGLASIHRFVAAVSHRRHVRAASRVLLVHDGC